MSLIGFHRFLIATAILFCLGFAGWEWSAFRRAGDYNFLVLGVIFAALGVGLGVYLLKLNHFLGYDREQVAPPE